jgi:hypothetical protein
VGGFPDAKKRKNAFQRNALFLPVCAAKSNFLSRKILTENSG